MRVIRPPRDLRLPRGNRRGSNCGITAVAVAAQVHFRTVWDHVAEAGHKPANWGGSVTEADLRRALRFFGVRYKSKLFSRSINVGHFVGVYARPGVLYVLDLNDHVALLKDGFIFDQRGRYFTVMDKGNWKLERVYRIVKD